MNIRLSDTTAEHWGVLACLTCGLVLCGALFMELIMGLAPCPLCMMQRVWFIIAGVIAYAGLAHNPRWGIYPLFTLAATLIGAGFSIRQLWLQSVPEDQVPACGPDLQYMLEAFPLSDLLVAMTSGTGDCAEVAWSLLGISIPGWALLAFVVVAVCAAMQLRQGLR